ncbi:hypothetical protein [Tindallia californiensis]|uniref:Uncharacterized protein n=1 Tax=Tindallia californiensis TaxID=159292 RepID=A0A1H3R1D9_9FIRM|nr:hypothetical protein [Tindallia californiensis]SDZ19642.1 hypothetical protein SAMN05192546_11191 [Tindallia californiensis]
MKRIPGGDRVERSTQENWYNNKELFEQMQELRKDFIDTKIAIKEFNTKFERYNGLWERISKLEGQPCQQKDEINHLHKLAKGILTEWNDFKSQRSTKEKLGDDLIKWSGWIIGAIGGIIGTLSLLGVF